MDSPGRVRANTTPKVNRQIDRNIGAHVRSYAQRSRGEITRHIRELDREWDIERWLEMNASALALTGLVLGLTHSRKWLALPGIVLPFLLQHALQGWCPPVPLFRRLGIRTREEIDREKHALKLLRGDYTDDPQMPRAEAALRAVETS